MTRVWWWMGLCACNAPVVDGPEFDPAQPSSQINLSVEIQQGSAQRGTFRLVGSDLATNYGTVDVGRVLRLRLNTGSYGLFALGDDVPQGDCAQPAEAQSSCEPAGWEGRADFEVVEGDPMEQAIPVIPICVCDD